MPKPAKAPLKGKTLLYFTSIFVSLGVFLFGYDQGVMSGIITGPYFNDYFNDPSKATIGTMVAILEIGALISSLVVGRLGDIIGRRRTIRYGAFIFVAGGLLQTSAKRMAHLVLGRIISGVGVGMLSTIVPIFQSEISPPHNRGKLACIEFTGNIIGYASSVWVDYGCSFIESHVSWRLPLFIQCIMGFLLFAGSFVICETPRWLLDTDHDEEGLIVIAALYAEGDVQAEKTIQEYKSIKETVLLHRLEGERSYEYMWRKYKRRVLIAMSSQALAQLNGINVISYYAPLVFEQAGWLGRDAILMTGINSIVYVACTIPPWYLVDRWGRRPILLTGAFFMCISLSLIAFFMWRNDATTPAMVVVFVVIYNGVFGYSWGPVPWLYPPEILPLSVRAKGASLSTASNWAFNWIVGEVTPVLQELIGFRLYLMHAGFCALSFVVVFVAYPETAGLTLEDMDSVFGDDSASSVFSSVSSYNRAHSLPRYADGDADSWPYPGGYGSVSASISSPRYLSAAALARQGSGAGFASETSPFMGHPTNTAASLISQHEIEPPDISHLMDSDGKYNLPSSSGISSAIRRGSTGVGSILGKIFKRDKGEEEEDAVVDGDESDVETGNGGRGGN